MAHLNRWAKMNHFDLFEGDGPCATGVRLAFAYTMGRFHSVDDVAAHFGLRPLASKWVVLSRDDARRALEHVLLFEPAHGSRRFEGPRAKAMADSFIARFPEGAQFSSNCLWFEKPKYDAAAGVCFPPNFESATSATFDGGVVVFSKILSGVFWLEDED